MKKNNRIEKFLDLLGVIGLFCFLFSSQGADLVPGFIDGRGGTALLSSVSGIISLIFLASFIKDMHPRQLAALERQLKCLGEPTAHEQTGKIVTPPESATVLLSLLLKPEETANILGDLEESFYDLNRKFGPRVAQAWYWRQTLTSIWPFLVRAGGKLVKWGLFGWVAHMLQWVHR